MTPIEVFESTLAKIRNAVKACVNELAVFNDAAARVAKSLALVNETKLALNTLRQAATECPGEATEEGYKAAVISSEKHLTACIENHELSQAVMGEIKAGAMASCEIVANGLNALQSFCLNDQHRADVDALMAEISECQAALRD